MGAHGPGHEAGKGKTLSTPRVPQRHGGWKEGGVASPDLPHGQSTSIGARVGRQRPGGGSHLLPAHPATDQAGGRLTGGSAGEAGGGKRRGDGHPALSGAPSSSYGSGEIYYRGTVPDFQQGITS